MLSLYAIRLYLIRYTNKFNRTSRPINYSQSPNIAPPDFLVQAAAALLHPSLAMLSALPR